MAQNFTLEQFADKIGMSRQKYVCIEKGTYNLTLEVLSKIAQVLKVPVKDITGILNEAPDVVYKSRNEDPSAKKIFDMLDLFYANKHLYEKLHCEDIEWSGEKQEVIVK